MRHLALALLLTLTACHTKATPIIDEVIQAYGGASAWSNIDLIRETGVVGTTMRGEGGMLTRELRPPDELLIVIEYPSHTEVRVVKGSSGTRDGQPVTGPQLDAMQLQRARIDLPRLLIARRKSVIDRGLGTRNGTRVHILEIPLPDNLVLTIEVDLATKHIIHTTGMLSLPNGTRMPFDTDYSDFRIVHGRLFPFVETTMAGGVVTGQTRLETIEVREKI